jgi:hypothetical protein
MGLTRFLSLALYTRNVPDKNARRYLIDGRAETRSIVASWEAFSGNFNLAEASLVFLSKIVHEYLQILFF